MYRYTILLPDIIPCTYTNCTSYQLWQYPCILYMCNTQYCGYVLWEFQVEHGWPLTCRVVTLETSLIGHAPFPTDPWPLYPLSDCDLGARVVSEGWGKWAEGELCNLIGRLVSSGAHVTLYCVLMLETVAMDIVTWLYAMSINFFSFVLFFYMEFKPCGTFCWERTNFYCLERSVHGMSFVSTDNSCGRFFCSIIVLFRTSWGWRTRQPLIYILLSPFSSLPLSISPSLSLSPSLSPSPSLSLSVSSGQRDQALDWKTAPPVFILSFLVLGSQKDAHCKQVILYIHVYVFTHSCQPFRNPSYCEYVCVWQFWKGTNPPLPGYAVKVWLQYKVSAADEISTYVVHVCISSTVVIHSK